MAITVLNKQQDIDYIALDYNSVVDDLTTFSTVNYGAGTTKDRKWTNYNNSSFSKTWLELIAFVSDILLFYLDNRATNSYLQTATVLSAVKDIAKQFGFVPASAQSASGNATFTVTQAVTIPRGFRVSSSSGVQFYVTSPTPYLAGPFPGQVTTGVLQGTIVSESFTALGIPSEEFDLAGPNVIVDLTELNPLDNTPQVSVNGNAYSLVDSFIWQNGTDTAVVVDSLGEVIGGGGRAFKLLERANGTPYVRFGDGLFGRKLVKGETISITYRTGGGSQGNISKNTLTSLLDSMTGVASVTNAADFSGGADEQSIEQLRDLIPASLRTLERAVAEQDYADLLKAKFTELLDVSASINTEDFGVDLNIYVIPQANTITQITDNLPLLTKLTNFVDRRKTVTVQFQILDAFGIDTLIGLEVFLENTASKTTVTQALQTALLDYFNLQTGGSDGNGIGFAEEILLKDIDTVVKTVSGISRFEIKKLTYRPRIEMNVRGLVSAYTTSSVEVFENVSESEWLVAASGEITNTPGAVLFNNPDSTAFTYDSTTGKVSYASPIDLNNISPGDLFRNGLGQFETTRIYTRGDNAGAKEKTKVVCISDQQGITEKSKVTAIADVSGSLFGTYFIIYDRFGSVGVWLTSGTTPQPSMGTNRAISVTISSGFTATQVANAIAVALNSDSEFSASLPVLGSDIINITNDYPYSVSDIVDGVIKTNFTFETTRQGVTPDSLGGTYFNIYDNTTRVKVWFNVGGSSTAPSVGVGERLIAVPITANWSATQVAGALQSYVDADIQFVATISGNTVYIEDTVTGIRTPAFDATDKPTGFTISEEVVGANSDPLVSKYFVLFDDLGSVAFWYKVSGSGSAPIGFTRTVEIDLVTGDTASTVASKTAATVDAKFNFVNPSSNIVDATLNLALPIFVTDGNAGTSGFTVTVTTQGSENDADFNILGVDTKYSFLYLDENLPVNPIGAIGAGGSIRQGPTSYQEFKCFKKINATSTNLAVDSITDSNMSLAIFSGTTAVLAPNVLIDNYNTLVPNAFSTGAYYLLDGLGNIWDILSNQDHTITTSVTAVNDPAISTVGAGIYKIIRKFSGKEVIFSGTVFSIDFNSDTTIYSIGAEFNQIGTIGDPFQISELQTNRGKLGVPADIISYNNSTGEVKLNGNPDLEDINTGSLLVDSTGEKFKIIAVDNRALPTVNYGTEHINLSNHIKLTNSGVGSQLSQGFKVTESAVYATVRPYLKRTGTFDGKLAVKIVEDDGTGLPDITKLKAISSYVNVNDIDSVSYETVVFSFETPPTLAPATQYHMILLSDASYIANFNSSTKYVEWGSDNLAASYADGKAESYDGVVWSDITSTDFIFEVSGTKSIVIKSNLAPAIGSGGTISERYYDDNDEISFVLGLSAGSTTGATDVNALGKGTVGAIPNTKVDTFIFRTSPYADDIVNLRPNEIPELSLADISIACFNGVA